MYLRLLKIKKEVNDFYILMIIKSIFLDQKRKKKKIVYVEDGFLQTFFNEDGFEINDNQKKAIEKFNKLPFHQKELIIESYDKSLRGNSKRIQYKLWLCI
jgi:phenylacetate-coenzyme A ligase PaaK-like adenylate-forming protein